MAKGKNIEYRKWEKKNLLLHIIRNDPESSRTSVKRKSRLSMESVLQYINELIQEGLIYEAGVMDQTVGRKATILRINPSGCYFIGVKFNVSAITGVVLDFEGNVVNQKRIILPIGINAQEVIELLYACIEDLLESSGDIKNMVRGIGIGVPGFVDSASGVAVRYVHINDWEMIPLKKLMEKRFGIETYIEQSIKVTALALKMKPENTNIRDMLYILVGRGVGMVIISNNMICNGYANGAGEIGHMYVADNGIKCECGKYGCLETETNNEAVLKKVRHGIETGGYSILQKLIKTGTNTEEKPDITIKDFVRSIELGDQDSVKLLGSFTRYLGEAVSTAVTLLNPYKIILSGDITAAPGFLEGIKEEIDLRCPIESTKELKIETSNNDDIFDAAGAAKLVWLYQFNAGTGVFDERYKGV